MGKEGPFWDNENVLKLDLSYMYKIYKKTLDYMYTLNIQFYGMEITSHKTVLLKRERTLFGEGGVTWEDMGDGGAGGCCHLQFPSQTPELAFVCC